MVNAALSNAFVQEIQEEDEVSETDVAPDLHEEAEPIATKVPESVVEAPVAVLTGPHDRFAAESRPGPLLLLLRCGQIWVAVPWRDVDQFGLAEDFSPAFREYSVQEILGGGAELRPEPYRYQWRHGDEEVAVTCERFGEVLDVGAAAAKGVQAVLLPAEKAENPPTLISLLDFASEWVNEEETSDSSEPVEDGSTEGSADLEEGVEISSTPAMSGEDAAPTLQHVEAPTPDVATIRSNDVETVTPSPDVRLDEEPTHEDVLATTLSDELKLGPVEAATLPDGREAEAAFPAPPSDAQGAPDAGGLAIESPSPAAPPTAPRDVPEAPVLHPVLATAPVRGPIALVAVRYLPARIAITRFLRASGWVIQEALDSNEIPVRLRQNRFDAVFTELFDRPSLETLRGLRQALTGGTAVVAVGSRLRVAGDRPIGFTGDLPRLLYPFGESDLERSLGLVRQS